MAGPLGFQTFWGPSDTSVFHPTTAEKKMDGPLVPAGPLGFRQSALSVVLSWLMGKRQDLSTEKWEGFNGRFTQRGRGKYVDGKVWRTKTAIRLRIEAPEDRHQHANIRFYGLMESVEGDNTLGFLIDCFNSIVADLTQGRFLKEHIELLL